MTVSWRGQSFTVNTERELMNLLTALSMSLPLPGDRRSIWALWGAKAGAR